MWARALVDPGDSGDLSRPEPLDELGRVAGALGCGAVAVVLVERVECGVDGERVVLVADRGVDAVAEQGALPRVRGKVDECVELGECGLVQRGRPSAGGAQDAILRRLVRLLHVVGEQPSPAGVAQPDGAPEPEGVQPLQARAEVEQGLFVH